MRHKEALHSTPKRLGQEAIHAQGNQCLQAESGRLTMQEELPQAGVGRPLVQDSILIATVNLDSSKQQTGQAGHPGQKLAHLRQG